MKILIASTNAGKIAIYAKVLDDLNLEWCSLKNFPDIISPDETASTAKGNAIIKAEYYHKQTGLAVIANDSALIIDKLDKNDQPGVFVRRQNGKELSDEEMISFFKDKLEAIGGSSHGHYDVGLAIVDQAGKLHVKLFKPTRFFKSTPCDKRVKGYPLDSLCYVKKFNKYRCELSPEQMNISEGNAFKKQIEFIEKVFKV